MRNKACLPLILFALTAIAATAFAAPSGKAIDLRNEGFAELENERPEKAEPLYRELVKQMPDDPLGHANLAIALLRQQKYPEAVQTIDTALAKAPGRADLLAIKGEILQWTGDLDGAMKILDQASQAAPEDLEILYAAYQLASTLRTPEADVIALRVLKQLAELRPENVVVLLQLGQRSIAGGDRTAASGAYQRLGELLWQEKPITGRALGMVTTALEKDDLSGARVPSIRLENVLKVSPMFRESLRELKTGIQGIPLQTFLDEPEISEFGRPIDIDFATTRLDERATQGRALAAGEFDGDGKADLARVRSDGQLEIRLGKAGWKVATEIPATGVNRLLANDLNNDGHLDLLGVGSGVGRAWLGDGKGQFTAAPDHFGLSAAGAADATLLDFDIEGDLDIVLVGGKSPVDLWRNSLDGGSLEQVGDKALPKVQVTQAAATANADFDRDGDLDLVVGHGKGFVWLDNLRQGRFQDRTRGSGLAITSAIASVVAADLTNDGYPDLVGVGKGWHLWRNTQGDKGQFAAWKPSGLPAGTFEQVITFDGDNDGRLDLAAVGEKGLSVLLQRDSGFTSAKLTGAPASASAILERDLDGDGDLDLVVAGASGLHWLENRGGNRNGWLVVRLQGLVKGNSKNNFYGVGSVVEVRNGKAYQFREASGDLVHFGLGGQKTADVMRVVWTNGVPQNRIELAGQQRLVEEQLLKGSCPFVYAWNGEEFAFVTDLLWGAPIGMPVAPGKYAPADPAELVRLDGLVRAEGEYRLRLTEELWEAAFFDHVRLWVVDHPADVEVASNLRVIPGPTIDDSMRVDTVLGSRDLRPVQAAWDGHGEDVTARVLARDDVYADGYTTSPYQGVAEEPWTFTFDLGEAPARAVRLHLDGWIFPADASLNLAVAQRPDLPYVAPRLEVETASGWQELVPNMGFPAGKTKTMVIDTPPLPEGASRLRIVTNLWLHWDRLAWTVRPADAEPTVRAQLAPSLAELRFRGFSKPVRNAPNGPHVYEYAAVSNDSPWLPMPGRYTRYGDVRELLERPDDLSVIMAPGDELELIFEASELPPPAPGTVRTLFLESHGWDKDADRNTYAGHQLEPLPFRGMSGYPYAPGESYPDTPVHRDYLENWLTREVQ